MPVVASAVAGARPNVVLICVDQWRGDCLSIDGHPVVETPYLDQLALDGVRFGRAYSATPSCIPARAALLTGLAPERHGRIGYQDGVPWDYPVTIASEFTRHCYQTEAIGKLHVYPERSQVGFQHVRLHDGYLHHARRHHPNHDEIDDYLPWLRRELGRDADYFDHGVNCNGVTTRPWDKPEHTHPSTWVVSEALRFFRQRDRRKPIFLYLGFHRPHPPYDPPRWAFEMYRDKAMPDLPRGDWLDILEPHRNDRRHSSLVARYPRAIADRARAGYYGHMSHIDHQLNRLLEQMREFGVLHDTWLLFVSDHGEMMGDHYLYQKSTPYEGSARVPLILKGPAGALPSTGVKRDAVVELRDIMPTLLDCARLPIPDGIDGVSLLPVAQGDAESVRPWLHGEHMVFGQTVQWVTDGHEKYAWWSATGREQLFDLDRDPLECHDLASSADHAGRLAHWREILVRELAGREDGHSDGERLVPGRPALPILPSVIAGYSEPVTRGAWHK